jgi:hypothetical protein
MSIYSGIAPSVLAARLTEAQDAYHALSIGAKAVSLGLGDKKITFTAADTRRLASYISQLQQANAVAQGISTSSGITAVASWIR